MDLFTDPRYLRYDEAGRPVTDPAELEALHEDIAARRVGLAVVSSPDGRHHVEVSTAFMVEMPALYEPKGGPFEMLVRRLDHPDAEPGATVRIGGRYPTRADAAEAHSWMVATLAKPQILEILIDRAGLAGE